MSVLMGQRCKTKYPLLLIHGVGFRDFKRPLYWGRIPEALQACGASVYYGLQDSWGSLEMNAAAIRRRIGEILDQTGCQKINLIGHSKGGLEARMAASSLGAGSMVASITTISTPHHGSLTIDRLLKAPRPLFDIAAFAVDNWAHLIGDRNSDFLAVCADLSARKMEDFNRTNPDCPGVFYQSFACVMRRPLSDVNLSVANLAVNLLEGENDGLVTVESARWGENFSVLRGAGRRGISHLDAIDFRRAPLSGARVPGRVSDICQVYVDIVKGLKERGF